MLSVREVPVPCLCLGLAVPGSAGWKRAGGWLPARPCCKPLCLSLGPGASSAAVQQLFHALCHAALACGTATVPPGLGSRCLTCRLSLQDVLNSKNATIKDLQLQLARVCKVREGAGAVLCVPPPRSGLGAVGWWMWLCGEWEWDFLLHALHIVEGRELAAELLCAQGQAGPSPGCSFPFAL